MRATPRPAKGSAAKATRARRRRIVLAEVTAKANAIIRDRGHCRRCDGAWALRDVEAAHIHDKGMGGDHGLHSSSPADYVTLCADCHRGPRSCHSGHVLIVPRTDRGGDGLVDFVDVYRPGENYREAR